MRTTPFRPRLLIVLLAVVGLTLAACGDDGDSGDDASGGDDGGTSTELSSYDTVAALNDELAAAGLTCELEYEGLADEVREISQCTLEGEAAVLTIWYDTSLLEEIVTPAEGDPAPATAYGANWTVEVQSDGVAATVAEAAGGTTT